MAREIKLIAWDEKSKTMHLPMTLLQIKEVLCKSTMGEAGSMGVVFAFTFSDLLFLQFTGRKGFNDKELYEGDIVFYEEATDKGDERHYLVIVWVEEWDMFASLHIEEYKKYLSSGAEELDESSFWTYNLRDSESFHYAGNIYENPDLLKK